MKKTILFLLTFYTNNTLPEPNVNEFDTEFNNTQAAIKAGILKLSKEAKEDLQSHLKSRITNSGKIAGKVKELIQASSAFSSWIYYFDTLDSLGYELIKLRSNFFGPLLNAIDILGYSKALQERENAKDSTALLDITKPDYHSKLMRIREEATLKFYVSLNASYIEINAMVTGC